MKIIVLQIGSVASRELKTLCIDYEGRLTRYTKLEVITLPDIKNAANLSLPELRKKEWEAFSSKLPKSSIVVLLDDKGKQYSSSQFASFINKQQTASVKELVFIIGGAFGFDEKAYEVAQQKLSLSLMTFSHQMVRLIFLEQLYRAYTIIKGEKYHHE
jgi:23S rRNA (pseudouridine1915-N3)-methyltransferase